MTPWKDPRRKSWASNGNLSVYVFVLLLGVWIAFQVWHGVGGPASPPPLDAMVMAMLGIAFTAKGKEIDKNKDKDDESSEGDDG